MTGRPPWPIAIVTGMLGSGKTTMIGRLLRHPAMTDTLVLVNEFGEIGLDHDLLKTVTDTVVLLPNGCLCCTVRDDIVQSLRELRSAWLAGTLPDFGRVLIETTGLAEPAPLVASLTSHPLLADSFALQTVTTVVDGQFAPSQLAQSATCRHQIMLADRLLVSKTDLIASTDHARLSARLGELNPLATIGSSQRLDVEAIFARSATGPRRSVLICDAPDDHLVGVSTILLKPGKPLGWTSFKIWLGSLLATSGDQLLRLKGRLTFDNAAARFIIQAVHHTFYPVVEDATTATGASEDFLVLIFEGPAPPDLTARCAEIGFVGSRGEMVTGNRSSDRQNSLSHPAV